MREKLLRGIKMIFKSKAIFPVLIFIACFSTSILQAAELAVPLPQDAVLVSQRGPSLGPLKSYDKIYRTSLNKNKLASFYKKEMSKAGWKEDGELNFIKDNDMAIILIDSTDGKTGKTSVIISTAKIPETKDVLAMRKKNPDKLNFMPIYPGSEQTYLSDLPSGIMAEYETESNIKEVAFFYKSAMLNYGWRFDSQTPVESRTADCAACKKSTLKEEALKPDRANQAAKVNQTILTFSKGDNETCGITITNISTDKDSLSSNKTIISVNYYEYRGNKS